MQNHKKIGQIVSVIAACLVISLIELISPSNQYASKFYPCKQVSLCICLSLVLEMFPGQNCSNRSVVLNWWVVTQNRATGLSVDSKGKQNN